MVWILWNTGHEREPLVGVIRASYGVSRTKIQTRDQVTYLLLIQSEYKYFQGHKEEKKDVAWDKYYIEKGLLNRPSTTGPNKNDASPPRVSDETGSEGEEGGPDYKPSYSVKTAKLGQRETYPRKAKEKPGFVDVDNV